MAKLKQPTGGEWNTACDSYGRVQHSRKYDCVYSVVKGNNGDRIVTVAARIENYADACLIAAAPAMLQALKFWVSIDWTKPQDAIGMLTGHNLLSIACKNVAAERVNSNIGGYGPCINPLSGAMCDELPRLRL